MEINNYPNYLIYEDGRVFSKIKNKFLKHYLYNAGYYRVNLCKNGKDNKFLIHRLIAEHYIPNHEKKRCVDHIDRNKLNNNLINLRWATHTENNNNIPKRITNTSGHSNVRYVKKRKEYIFRKDYKSKFYQKYFKTLKEALCYKYIFLLKIKSNII